MLGERARWAGWEWGMMTFLYYAKELRFYPLCNLSLPHSFPNFNGLTFF